MSSEKLTLGEMRRFWERQALSMERFQHASSTQYYLEDEKRLIEFSLNGQKECKVLKLDLWNEVKNTNILAWMASKGATTHAVDISFNLTKQANDEFLKSGLTPRFSVASLYELPFKSKSFDFLYTMGTIEHAPDMDRCVAEIFRVLKPGGVALVGVPNKHDPFLRPLVVYVMNKLGIYPYGFEQSLTSKELSAMLKKANFEVLKSYRFHFMSEVLRMFEMTILKTVPLWSRMVVYLHWPFRLLAKTFPNLHRHGYLVACIVRRPSS